MNAHHFIRCTRIPLGTVEECSRCTKHRVIERDGRVSWMIFEGSQPVLTSDECLPSVLAVDAYPSDEQRRAVIRQLGRDGVISADDEARLLGDRQ